MSMAQNKLQKYRGKRDFSVTREPKGSVKRAKKEELKFSVQRHLARADHFDLRLEIGGVAVSWAVPKGPSYNTKDKRLAMRVEDHPLDYMDFEGTIPKGEYGGGTVMLWDEGEWKPRSDPEEGLKEGSLKFTLNGARLKGDWALVRMKGSEEKGEPWLLIKEKDAFAKSTAGISRFLRGVRSKKTMAEIERAENRNPFERADVMLAELVDSLPSDMGWVYELKYDGHRVLGFCENGKARLVTRNGNSCTAAFALAAEALAKLLGGRAAVVDGEMVVVGRDGISDFGALQRYARSKNKEGLCYVLFDLLALDGKDLRGLPLLERKEKLKALLTGAPPVLKYSEHTGKMTKKNLETLEARGMEGIVVKRANSPYTAGKCGDWLKLKFRKTREFVIGGYCVSDAGTLKSLLVGYYEGGDLVFAGCVGTGFSEETRRELQRKLTKTARKNTPFESVPKGYEKGAVWVGPALAAQVEYAEITASGLLRQASFQGLRRDKKVSEIDAEKPRVKKGGSMPETKPDNKIKTQTLDMVRGICVTHPEKILFPKEKISKLELVRYYEAVAFRMLPYVKDRLLSLVCCPNGIEGEMFFRRHLGGKFAGLGYAVAKEEENYFYLKNEEGILSLAQYNAVEFHVWGSRKSSPERPDTMVFDLDPDEDLPLADVRRGARDLKEILWELGLKCFLKTSGGKGYHIVVPFKAGAEKERFSAFAKEVALLMEQACPARYTATMSKKQRVGKIFIDWQRNTAGATSVAPYSVRARAGTPVSMPIAWEELPRVAPSSVTLKTALRRLNKPDPWENYFDVKRSQSLNFRAIK